MTSLLDLSIIIFATRCHVCGWPYIAIVTDSADYTVCPACSYRQWIISVPYGEPQSLMFEN